MRINNISDQRSLRNFNLLFIVIILLTTGIVKGCIYAATQNSLCFWENLRIFFSFFGNSFFDCIIPLSILGVYIWFFVLASLKIKRWFEFYHSLNIKYVNFLPDIVEFVYTDPRHNFSCMYSEIQNLNIDFFLNLINTKSGTFVFMKEMDLRFTISEDKVFTISNTTYFPFGVVRKIIDRTRGVQSFTFNLLQKSGTFAIEFDKDQYKYFGELRDFKSRIENYLKFGNKTMLSKEYENSLTYMSLFMFGFAVFLSLSIMTCMPREDFLTGFLPAMLLVIGLTVVFDVILFKNDGTKLKIEHKCFEKKSLTCFSDDFPIQKIIKLKVIVLVLSFIAMVYFYNFMELK